MESYKTYGFNFLANAVSDNFFKFYKFPITIIRL